MGVETYSNSRRKNIAMAYLPHAYCQVGREHRKTSLKRWAARDTGGRIWRYRAYLQRWGSDLGTYCADPKRGKGPS